MNKAIIGLVAIGGSLWYLSKKANASTISNVPISLPPVSDTPLDSGMTGEQFDLWQRLIQLEGRPKVLDSQVDGYRALGFTNSANRLAQKAKVLRDAGVE